MELRHLLVERKGTILERWFGAVVRTYPEDARKFLRRDSERFANPVGATTRRALGGILDGLASEDPQAACVGPLREVLRIRAVQDFAPSGAVGFVLELKHVLREDLAEAGVRDVSQADLAAWDEWADRLALIAFDLYVAFREQVFELRSAELKNRMYTLLRKADLVVDADGAGDEAQAEQVGTDDRALPGEAEGTCGRTPRAAPETDGGGFGGDAEADPTATEDPGRSPAGRSPPTRRGGS